MLMIALTFNVIVPKISFDGCLYEPKHETISVLVPLKAKTTIIIIFGHWVFIIPIKPISTKAIYTEMVITLTTNAS